MVFLARFKISGHSMQPLLNPGQEILVSFLPFLFSKPKIGDVIAFEDSGKAVIKRIKKINGDKIYVTGDNKSDSKQLGWIEKVTIIGKIVYIFKT